jgi:hypothetical protein
MFKFKFPSLSKPKKLENSDLVEIYYDHELKRYFLKFNYKLCCQRGYSKSLYQCKKINTSHIYNSDYYYLFYCSVFSYYTFRSGKNDDDDAKFLWLWMARDSKNCFLNHFNKQIKLGKSVESKIE